MAPHCDAMRVATRRVRAMSGVTVRCCVAVDDDDDVDDVDDDDDVDDASAGGGAPISMGAARATLWSSSWSRHRDIVARRR